MSQDATLSRDRVIFGCVLLLVLLTACSPSTSPVGTARPGPGDAGEATSTRTQVATAAPPIGEAGTPESRPPDQDATKTAIPVPVATAPPTSPLDLALVIDPVVAKAIDEFDLVGLTIGVRQGMSQPFIRAYGHADMFASTPADPADIYPIASVTKQFTAAAVMQLAEAVRLSLDGPISEFISGAPATWEGITVRHLLNHTSGLADLNEAAIALLDVNRGNTLEEVIAVIEGRSRA
jgi:CubicO group peptidase (beta-lactamase class C family)